MTMPIVGQRAPDFSSITDDGSTLELKSLRGTTVVLFFYPKAAEPSRRPGSRMPSLGSRDSMHG
jgi:peroxiredoxin